MLVRRAAAAADASPLPGESPAGPRYLGTLDTLHMFAVFDMLYIDMVSCVVVSEVFRL